MNLSRELPIRRGHFLLESGYHSDTWLSLDALFADPSAVAPLVGALTDRLRAHAPTVDDVISAGSSVRATVAALTTAGASTVVVGSFLVLGDMALEHFSEQGVPMETLQHSELDLWKPSECPLCRSGAQLEDPR